MRGGGREGEGGGREERSRAVGWVGWAYCHTAGYRGGGNR